ncbi:hypothetical protein QTN25_006669 [Entamoeba marina]
MESENSITTAIYNLCDYLLHDYKYSFLIEKQIRSTNKNNSKSTVVGHPYHPIFRLYDENCNVVYDQEKCEYYGQTIDKETEKPKTKEKPRNYKKCVLGIMAKYMDKLKLPNEEFSKKGKIYCKFNCTEIEINTKEIKAKIKDCNNNETKYKINNVSLFDLGGSCPVMIGFLEDNQQQREIALPNILNQLQDDPMPSNIIVESNCSTQTNDQSQLTGSCQQSESGEWNNQNQQGYPNVLNFLNFLIYTILRSVGNFNDLECDPNLIIQPIQMDYPNLLYEHDFINGLKQHQNSEIILKFLRVLDDANRWNYECLFKYKDLFNRCGKSFQDTLIGLNHTIYTNFCNYLTRFQDLNESGILVMPPDLINLNTKTVLNLVTQMNDPQFYSQPLVDGNNRQGPSTTFWSFQTWKERTYDNTLVVKTENIWGIY